MAIVEKGQVFSFFENSPWGCLGSLIKSPLLKIPYYGFRIKDPLLKAPFTKVVWPKSKKNNVLGLNPICCLRFQTSFAFPDGFFFQMTPKALLELRFWFKLFSEFQRLGAWNRAWGTPFHESWLGPGRLGRKKKNNA